MNTNQNNCVGNIIFSANKLEEAILEYWREHQGFNAVRLINLSNPKPSLFPRTLKSDNNTVSGAYFFNINGNDGFMCNLFDTIDQHAADLLCQSLGYSNAEKGNGTGWFNQGKLSPGIKIGLIYIVFICMLRYYIFLRSQGELPNRRFTPSSCLCQM